MNIILAVIFVVCLLIAGIFNFASTGPDKFLRIALGLTIIALAILAVSLVPLLKL